MNTENQTQRNPWTAVGLNLLLPGLGQVYCGTLLRGLVFMALSGILVIGAILPAISGANSAGFWFVLMWLISVGIVAAAAIDSWRLSRRTREDYQLKEYNRWQVYVLLLVIASGGALGYALYVRDALVQPFRIPQHSMYPSIRAGDMVIAAKGAYVERDPGRGEVIIFRNPENRKRFYVKRVVAVAGETVEVRSGDLYVNGERATVEAGEERVLRLNGKTIPGSVVQEKRGDRSYTLFLPDDDAQRARNDIAPTVVPKHHVFVMGDNRSNSKDSRQFGPVPVAAVVGKVAFIYFSGEDWSRFGKFEA